MTEAELKAQGRRCGCRGSNDLCGCQNVEDDITLFQRADYAGAFLRNCPDLAARMTGDEKDELRRLFVLCAGDQFERGQRTAREE